MNGLLVGKKTEVDIYRVKVFSQSHLSMLNFLLVSTLEKVLQKEVKPRISFTTTNFSQYKYIEPILQCNCFSIPSIYDITPHDASGDYRFYIFRYVSTNITVETNYTLIVSSTAFNVLQ